MGTSTSYGGPTGQNPLLPSWAPPVDTDNTEKPGESLPTPPDSIAPLDQEELETQDQESLQILPIRSIPWAGPKASLSRFASSGSRRSLRSAIRGFVQAQGGSRHAARAAIAGRSSAQRLGGFLSSVVNDGAAAAARSLGLQRFVGQDANALLAVLVDRIAPAGALLEDAVARAATAQTLDELFQKYAVQENGLAALDSLDHEGVKDILEKYLGNYIYTRLIQVISRKLESRRTDDVVRVENAIKGYVFSTVHLDIIRRTDVLSIRWDGQAGQDFVQRIYQEGYELIEKYLL